VITGIHALIYAPDAVAVREFLRDKLGWANVDNGDGWLIFALPPAELGVHPAGGDGGHELYLLCDDIEATVAELSAKGVEFTGPPVDRGFGVVATMNLPGGGALSIYEPKHRLAIGIDGSQTVTSPPVAAPHPQVDPS
jgi:catechol 2,3-dioxygenase-like lactoylglutathione lyase family enzyme